MTARKTLEASKQHTQFRLSLPCDVNTTTNSAHPALAKLGNLMQLKCYRRFPSCVQIEPTLIELSCHLHEWNGTEIPE